MRLSVRRVLKEDNDDSVHPERLPLRWALILLASLATGITLALLSGPLAGVVSAATIAGLLHTILV